MCKLNIRLLVISLQCNAAELVSEMVLGDKHYKHTDEGPCRSSRRTRSPFVAVPASTANSATASATTSTDDADGIYFYCLKIVVLQV